MESAAAEDQLDQFSGTLNEVRHGKRLVSSTWAITKDGLMRESRP
eukprot:COSAG06_NODE_15648_length_1055_cov_1.284519_2_plen_44_part_01